MNERDHFLIKDKISEIESLFIKDGWLTVYETNHLDRSDLDDQLLIYCGLIDSKQFPEFRKNYDWEISPGSEGKPSIISTFNKGKSKTKYYTNSDKGIEPFIFSRFFQLSEGSDRYIDISEEFILYFKLYEKGTKQNRKYYFIDDLGELDEVILVNQINVKVKLKYLKEYLSIRKFYLFVYFDFMRLTNKTFEELNIKPVHSDFTGENYIYNHFMREVTGKSQSWIRGKAFIAYDKSKVNSYHFDSDERYTEFIVGYDNNGNEKLLSCEDSPDKSFVLTYFKKEVLNKYYNEPSKYKVDGWDVSSKFFRLKIDNNIEDYVAVFLTNLRMLPFKEQLHWKQYNIQPQKGISSVYFQTMVDGNWVDHPEAIDLFFKFKYEQFNKNWEKKFGWKFYKPLATKDTHIFTALHLPTTNNVKSFCEQILSIVKLTIDRLNEAEFAKYIVLEKNDRGITKLEKFVTAKEIEIPDMIIFLRHLWNLRSGLLSHSFSESNKDCKEAISYFKLTDNYIEVAKNIFVGSISTLNTLEEQFFKK